MSFDKYFSTKVNKVYSDRKKWLGEHQLVQKISFQRTDNVTNDNFGQIIQGKRKTFEDSV